MYQGEECGCRVVTVHTSTRILYAASGPRVGLADRRVDWTRSPIPPGSCQQISALGHHAPSDGGANTKYPWIGVSPSRVRTHDTCSRLGDGVEAQWHGERGQSKRVRERPL